MLLTRRCRTAITRPETLRCLSRCASSTPSGNETRSPSSASNAEFLPDAPGTIEQEQHQQQQQQPRDTREHQQHQQLLLQQQQRQQQRQQRRQQQQKQKQQQHQQQKQQKQPVASTSSEINSNRHGLDMLVSAMREVALARKDLGWGADALAMRITMLAFLRRRNTRGRAGGIPREATLAEGGRERWGEKASEWERFLRWAHASYAWTEQIAVKRAGFSPGEVEVIALSRGKSRNRPMAPTYILAVDHPHREVVLAVRGTKAFGDAITITHFRPEPFLDGYAHRGFAQSAHELVKEIGPQLADLRDRLPDYRICFTGHSMGGGVAAMASMLLRESTNKRCQQQQQQQQGREQLARTAAGARLGVPEGPVVFSFATPSCVSLDLARRCQPWVDSIVHADDAIPRLSTVSLELLKEDLTAAEWRRAVGRLSHLNTVFPSSKSAAAAAAAIKEALSGIGALGRVEQRAVKTAAATATASSATTAAADRRDDVGQTTKASDVGDGVVGGGVGGGVGDSRSSGKDGSGSGPRGAGGGGGGGRDGGVGGGCSGDSAAKGLRGAEARGERTSSGGIVSTVDREGKGAGAGAGVAVSGVGKQRKDLGRSIRDTVLTMRGLAKLYPLSRPLRDEIATVVSQVLKLTGGEKGSGGGGGGGDESAFGQERRKNGAPEMVDRDQSSGISNSLSGNHSTSSTFATTSAATTAAVAAAASVPGAAADGAESSRPMLLSTLKDNLESLGASRAALHHESTGVGSSDGRSSGDGRGGGGGVGSVSGGGASCDNSGGGGEDDTAWVRQQFGRGKAQVRRGDSAAAAGQGGDSHSATGAGGAPERATGRGIPAMRKTDDGWSPPPPASYDSGGQNRTADGSCYGPDARVSGEACAGSINHSGSGGSSSSSSSRINSSSSGGDGDGGSSNESKGKRPQKTAAAVLGRGEDDDYDDNRLQFLHEAYVARPEPSLLPLYPPGDQFLVHNSCRGAVTESAASAGPATSSSAASAHQPIADVVNSYRSGSGGDGRGGGGSDSIASGSRRNGFSANVALTRADDSRGWEGATSTGSRDAVSTETVAFASAVAADGNINEIGYENEIGQGIGNGNGIGRGNQMGNKNGSNNENAIGVGDGALVNAQEALTGFGRSSEAGRQSAQAGDNVVRTERQRSRDARVRLAAADGLDEAAARAGKASGTALRGEEGGRSASNMLLMRVPHQHFLRMALSPSMLEDHTMSSYRRALQGLRKRGEE